MRSKTNDEKEFNKLAKKHGLKAFTAKEFDKDPELQEAFQSFVECNAYLSSFTTLYHRKSNISKHTW